MYYSNLVTAEQHMGHADHKLCTQLTSKHVPKELLLIVDLMYVPVLVCLQSRCLFRVRPHKRRLESTVESQLSVSIVHLSERRNTIRL